MTLLTPSEFLASRGYEGDIARLTRGDVLSLGVDPLLFLDVNEHGGGLLGFLPRWQTLPLAPRGASFGGGDDDEGVSRRISRRRGEDGDSYAVGDAGRRHSGNDDNSAVYSAPPTMFGSDGAPFVPFDPTLFERENLWGNYDGGALHSRVSAALPSYLRSAPDGRQWVQGHFVNEVIASTEPLWSQYGRKPSRLTEFMRSFIPALVLGGGALAVGSTVTAGAASAPSLVSASPASAWAGTGLESVSFLNPSLYEFGAGFSSVSAPSAAGGALTAGELSLFGLAAPGVGPLAAESLASVAAQALAPSAVASSAALTPGGIASAGKTAGTLLGLAGQARALAGAGGAVGVDAPGPDLFPPAAASAGSSLIAAGALIAALAALYFWMR